MKKVRKIRSHEEAKIKKQIRNHEIGKLNNKNQGKGQKSEAVPELTNLG